MTTKVINSIDVSRGNKVQGVTMINILAKHIK